jgi:hypothetical protein
LPKVEDLLERVQRSTGYPDRFHIIDLFNDALNQLMEGAKLEGETELAFTNGVANLPLLFKSPIALIDGPISNPNNVYPPIHMDDLRTGFTVYGGKVYLKNIGDGTYKLMYYRYANSLVNNGDTPEIDTQFHELLTYYAIGMIYLMTDKDKGTIDRMLGAWENGKERFQREMMRKQKKDRVRETVRW